MLTDPGGIDQKNRDRKLVTVSHYLVKVKKNSFQKRRKIAEPRSDLGDCFDISKWQNQPLKVQNK